MFEILLISLLSIQPGITDFPFGIPLNLCWEPGNLGEPILITSYNVQVDSATPIIVTTNDPGVIDSAAACRWMWKIPNELLTVGDHSVKVRACDSKECGPYSTPFTFKIIPVAP